MILDIKLDFQEQLREKLSKISKTIWSLRKLQKLLTRDPLLTIYKSFIRPHLDYSDIIYDEAYNSSFHQKIQYNSALAITGAIRRTSKENLYQELGLESLEKDDGIEKFVIFIRSSTNNLPDTFSIILLCLAYYSLQDTSKMFLLLKWEMIF